MEITIFDGVRTPFGKHGGVLAFTRPDDMLAQCIKYLVEKSPDIKPILKM
ncbi:hypothetical protein JCM19232_4501 [Vibrio ishigakensis]|uniref:Acetyl-CoA C-acyltransferase n=1 Tax=Vibrio ishigakensis TaxID=1481914 RepID=A0A0B8PJA6_9VIBR|nr:hypothetical protein JCM19232_4501 [Vibrio ishigakensis]